MNGGGEKKVTDMKDDEVITELLREDVAHGPDEVFVQRTMDAIDLAMQPSNAFLRRLPVIFGLLGFCLSGWVFFDYSIAPLLGQSIVDMATVPIEAIQALIVVSLAASLWVFTELE